MQGRGRGQLAWSRTTHVDQVLELAFEVLGLGEDRETVRAGGEIRASLGDGVDAFADLADAGRGALDFGDDGQTSGDRQGLTEAGRRRAAREGRQFGVGDGTGERGDFPALGVHDFGQLVHWP